MPGYFTLFAPRRGKCPPRPLQGAGGFSNQRARGVGMPSFSSGPSFLHMFTYRVLYNFLYPDIKYVQLPDGNWTYIGLYILNIFKTD